MPVSIGSFKGNATITLNPQSKWPFSFGIAKARLIVENFAEIKAWVDSQPQVAPKAAAVGSVRRNGSGRCEDAPCCGCCE